MSTPTLSEFQYEIGARMGRGDWHGAAAAAAGCRAAWPHDFSGWLFGSMAALFADDKATALALVEERLATEPHNPQCLVQKAECLFALGRREPAIAAAEDAADCADRNPQALDAAATFLAYAGDFEGAVRVYDRAIAAAPRDASLLLKRAAANQYLGRFDLAARDYEEALAISPTNAEALKGLAELRLQTPEHNVIAGLEAALTAPSGDPRDAAALHFGLAKSYDDLARYPESWRHLAAANKIERARLNYDPQQDRVAIERIIAGFPDVEAVYSDATGESPIFILGLPRTGTTLVERIIGNHTLVHSAGESSALADALAGTANLTEPVLARSVLGFVGVLEKLDGALIARDYLSRLQARRGDRARFSDKTPANFFFCALIFRAFPRARIVHLTRHPLAACFAIYKMRFNSGYPFSYDLGDIADFYLGYRKLMAHWHGILPGRMLDLAYEDVVTRQKETTCRLLDYLGLPFEEGCLDFHLNPASTSTASSVQVRQPLYETSLQQWRHYEQELMPLRERLAAGGIVL